MLFIFYGTLFMCFPKFIFFPLFWKENRSIIKIKYLSIKQIFSNFLWFNFQTNFKGFHSYEGNDSHVVSTEIIFLFFFPIFLSISWGCWRTKIYNTLSYNMYVLIPAQPPRYRNNNKILDWMIFFLYLRCSSDTLHTKL